MACKGVVDVCVEHASCAVLNEGYTCRCNIGYSGNGFQNCQFEGTGGLEGKYIYIIVLIVLLLIGLTAIVVFLMCKRRLSEKPMRQPLVGTTELSPYEMKWQMAGGQSFKEGSGDKQDGPPPYNVIDEKKEVPIDEMLSFQPVEVGRVPVDDDDVNDEVDDVKDFDNPSYSTIAAARGSSGSEEVKTDEPLDPMEEGITNPSYEAERECTPAEEDLVETPEREHAIAVTFTDGDEPNTVAAHITTPDANLTINLNITIPGQTVIPIETVE